MQKVRSTVCSRRSVPSAHLIESIPLRPTRRDYRFFNALGMPYSLCAVWRIRHAQKLSPVVSVVVNYHTQRNCIRLPLLSLIASHKGTVSGCLLLQFGDGMRAQKKERQNICLSFLGGDYLLSHFRSTIGVVRLNFSVRNGKRWNPHAVITLVFYLFQPRSSRP